MTTEIKISEKCKSIFTKDGNDCKTIISAHDKINLFIYKNKLCKNIKTEIG